MIESFSHLTFVVQGVARTVRLLTQVPDAREAYDSGPQGFSLSQEKFLLTARSTRAWKKI